MIGARQEQFNNLTGDIELNPGSFGLFMRDIDEASLNLKTAIYSGNINLTADLYKQLESLSEKKYNAIEPDGSINTTRLEDTTMTGKSAGLYMNHQRMGFWTGTDWKAFIGNTGEMWLGSITDSNYLNWTGTTLDIKGNITAGNISGVDIEGSTIQSSSGNNIVLLNGGEIRQMNTLGSTMYTTLFSYGDITFVKQIVGTPGFDVNLDIGQIGDGSKITFGYSGNTKGYIASNEDGIEIYSSGILNISGELEFDQIDFSSHTDSGFYMPIKISGFDYFIKLYS